jgi:hypothetical protein
MKKLAFLFAAFVAVSFASCGNKAEQATEGEGVDTLEQVEDTLAADTVAADTVAADSVAE